MENKKKIEITYKLYMRISDETIIVGMKVNVIENFEEKKLPFPDETEKVYVKIKKNNHVIQ